jgi:hypothetical protein
VLFSYLRNCIHSKSDSELEQAKEDVCVVCVPGKFSSHLLWCSLWRGLGGLHILFLVCGVCMYVYMYVCLYVFVYVCMYVYTHTHTYTYTHAHSMNQETVYVPRSVSSWQNNQNVHLCVYVCVCVCIICTSICV